MIKNQSNLSKKTDRDYNRHANLSIENEDAGPRVRVLLPVDPPCLTPAAGQAILRMLTAAHESERVQATPVTIEEPRP
jgi:hypothetical protein